MFCIAYAGCFNGRKAYQEAVDSSVKDTTAASAASKWLAKPEVRSRVAELVAEKKKNLELDSNLIIHELMLVAFGSIANFIGENGFIDFEKVGKATLEEKRAISEISLTAKGEAKIKMHDKLKALELLGKHLKLWTDKIEHGGDPQNPIVQRVIMFRKPGEVKNEPQNS